MLENYYIELEKNDRDTDLDLTQISARFNVNKSMIVHWASVFEENVQNIGKAGPKRRGRKRRKYSN